MRIRLPELLDEYDVTAYAIAKRSKGRILPATLYRLVKARGVVKYIDAELLEALYDTLELKNINDLVARGDPPPAKKPAARKRGRGDR